MDSKEKAKMIEGVYNTIRHYTRTMLGIQRGIGTAEGIKPLTLEEFNEDVTLTYLMFFTWVKNGILEIVKPTLFKEIQPSPEIFTLLGKDIYLDEAIRRAIPLPKDIPEAFYNLTKIPLTPEVLETLNSEPLVIYSRLFKGKDIQEVMAIELRIEELYQLIPPGRTPPKVYRTGRGDLTYPLAILGKPKPGQNYVTFIDEKNGIKTEAGSMYGVLTEFDFRVLCAIVAFTQRVKDKTGKIIAVARFSQYSIARYLR